MENQEDYLITYLEEALQDAQKVGDYLAESGNWIHTCSIAKIQTGINQAIVRLKKQQDGIT
jgi:hypothetical protein